MKAVYKIIVPILVVMGLFSCESDYGPFNRDNRPEIPLQFTNTTSFGHDPYVAVSEDGEIRFEMEIPATSGRTIKEITKVAAGLTGLNPGALNTEGDYITTPIAGDGNRVTFTTTLEEFREKRPTLTVNVPETGYTEVAFFFLVTLDNGDTIVSMRARARISK